EWLTAPSAAAISSGGAAARGEAVKSMGPVQSLRSKRTLRRAGLVTNAAWLTVTSAVRASAGLGTGMAKLPSAAVVAGMVAPSASRAVTVQPVTARAAEVRT